MTTIMGNCGPNNVYGESYPLFFITGLIGLRPFQICKTTVFGFLYVIIVLTSYCALYWYTIIETLDLFEEMSVYTLIMRLRIYQAVTNVFLVIFTIIISSVKSLKIRKVYAVLKDVDENLKFLNVKFDYGKAMRRDIIHIFEITIYTILFNLLEYFPLQGPNTTKFFLVIWLANSIPQFVNTMAIASFVIIILKIRRRLEAINEFIPNLMIVEKNSITTLEMEMNSVFRLRLLNKIHEKLVNAATILNETHGLVLLTSFTVYFLTACMHLRTIYFTAGKKPQLIDFCVESFWLIFYLAKYLYVIDTCHSVMVQVKKSGQILRDKWTDNDHHPLKQEADAMAQRVESRSLQLTACNFFVIDYPTLKKIVIGLAVYTFLVANFTNPWLTMNSK